MPVHWVRESAHDGYFTVESDRARVAKVMQTAFEAKLGSLHGSPNRLDLFRYLVAGQNRLLGLPNSPLTVESFPARFGFQSMEAAVKAKTGIVATACAVLAEDVGMLRHLVAAGAELNPQLPGVMEAGLTRGWTPLHLAASHCHSSVVEELLKLKANPNACNLAGMPCLGFCSNVEAVDLLLSNRAEVNFAKPPGGLTPLALSCIFCAPTSVMGRLLKARADPNDRGCGVGQAALSTLAVSADGNANLPEAVQLLLHARADINLAGRARGVARLYGLLCRLGSCRKQPLLERYLAEGSCTALGIAALLGREQLVRLLLKAHADPELPNNRGHTAIQLANRACIVQVLQAETKHQIFAEEDVFNI